MNLLCLILLVSAPETVSLEISQEGKKLGTAQITHDLLPDGGKRVEVVIMLQGSKVRDEAVYSSSGMPVRKLRELTSKEVKSQSIAVFEPGKVRVTTIADGKSKTSEISLEKGAPVAARSEFWFLRDQPKVGSRDVYYRFDLDSLRWNLVETIYKGREKVTVLGKVMNAHALVSGEARVFCDDLGLPILVLRGAVKMERVEK